MIELHKMKMKTAQKFTKTVLFYVFLQNNFENQKTETSKLF